METVQAHLIIGTTLEPTDEPTSSRNNEVLETKVLLKFSPHALCVDSPI